MSSVKREYSLPAPSITHVEVTSGTGTDANKAEVYIDPRVSSVFRVDISDMTGQDTLVIVELDTFEKAPGVVPGKEITILFSGNPNSNSVRVYFSSNISPNLITSDTRSFVLLEGNLNGAPTAIKLMSDGTDFVVLSRSDITD